jgi:hypothetical protein
VWLYGTISIYQMAPGMTDLSFEVSFFKANLQTSCSITHTKLATFQVSFPMQFFSPEFVSKHIRAKKTF